MSRFLILFFFYLIAMNSVVKNWFLLYNGIVELNFVSLILCKHKSVT